jgi:hypothetical protein
MWKSYFKELSDINVRLASLLRFGRQGLVFPLLPSEQGCCQVCTAVGATPIVMLTTAQYKKNSAYAQQML